MMANIERTKQDQAWKAPTTGFMAGEARGECGEMRVFLGGVSFWWRTRSYIEVVRSEVLERRLGAWWM